MHWEPNVGFDSGSPGLRPGPKAGAKPLRHPGIPVSLSLKCLHLCKETGLHHTETFLFPPDKFSHCRLAHSVLRTLTPSHPFSNFSIASEFLAGTRNSPLHSRFQETEVPAAALPAFPFPGCGYSAHPAFLSAGSQSHPGSLLPELGADSCSEFWSYHQSRSQP